MTLSPSTTEHRAFPARSKLLALTAALFLALSNSVLAFETKAKQAFLIDAETGSVLLAKNADEKIPPASLAKLMAMETVFHAVEEGRTTLATEYPVSEYAWRTGGAPSGGSTMFAALKSRIRLYDLIRGVIVQSANDGAIIIAEGLSGSEEKFATEMNERAKAIGLKSSTFKNSNGLPADGQFSTVRDLALLGRHIWRTYPHFYRIYSAPDFTWNKITQRNRNPLLAMGFGADGMKTGFTDASGYAIVGSVVRGPTRLFAAMSGMASDKERADEARKLLEWGLTGFDRKKLFEADEIIGSVRVFGGDRGAVPVKAEGAIPLLVPNEPDQLMTAKIVYEGPVFAPVATGDQVATLKVWIGNTLTREAPLFAAESVGVGSIHSRSWDAFKEFAFGWLG